MLRCAKCKRVTNCGETTGMLISQIIWKDKDGKAHKDITEAERVCMNCNGVKKFSRGYFAGDKDGQVPKEG